MNPLRPLDPPIHRRLKSITMIRPTSCTNHLIALIAACSVGALSAATPLPSWDGDPGSTRQGYLFNTGSLAPTANFLANSYGVPSASITLGSFNTGWQDPLGQFTNPGADGDGAWDLGIAGFIDVQVPVAPAPADPGTHYRVDFQVWAVAYQGITALPAFSAVGLSAEDLASNQHLVAIDPEFPGASWQGITWTGYFDDVTTDHITFRIQAPSNNISVIDTYEVFTLTTLVPEPSASLLLIAAASLGLRSRRKS